MLSSYVVWAGKIFNIQNYDVKSPELTLASSLVLAVNGLAKNIYKHGFEFWQKSCQVS